MLKNKRNQQGEHIAPLWKVPEVFQNPTQISIRLFVYKFQFSDVRKTPRPESAAEKYESTTVGKLYMDSLQADAPLRSREGPLHVPGPSVHSKYHTRATFQFKDQLEIRESNKEANHACRFKPSQILSKVQDKWNHVTAASENEVQDLVKCLLKISQWHKGGLILKFERE